MVRRFISTVGEQESIREVFRVAEKQLRPNRNGNLYLQMELSDRTGTLSARLWNSTEAIQRSFDVGDYVLVEGATQILQPHRLGEEVVHPRGQTLLPLGVERIGGEGHDVGLVGAAVTDAPGGLHAVEAVELLLDACRAGGARHPGHLEVEVLRRSSGDVGHRGRRRRQATASYPASSTAA